MNEIQPARIPDRSRLLPVAGAVNFRDLGGYPTVSGRIVRWGHIFRSDSLSELTDDDIAVIGKLGLRSICDLRDQREQARNPNRLPPIGDPIVHTIGFYPHGAQDLMLRIRAKQIAATEAKDLLLETYRALPLMHAASYAKLLAALAAPGALPALIHCTSGKDRTGFAAAIVLQALGVPREVIIEDYLLTNQYRRDLSFMLGDEVDPDVMEVVTSAREEFLVAAFDSIDAQWGNVERYLKESLAVTDATRERLQTLLLEAAA